MQCTPTVVVEHLIKASRSLEHERHPLIDIRKIRQRIVAKTDGASILSAQALAGEGQLDGLGTPEGKPVT